MSAIGTRFRNRRVARLVRNTGADTPYRLLWSTGITALVLCIVAFTLWGINGAGILFDMIVALCI
jgi:hypothetical protein